MSDAEKGSFVSNVIGDRKCWGTYNPRARSAGGERAASMFEDLAGLFEQAAVDGTPIREILGEDSAGFVEVLIQNYSQGGYVPTRAQKRLGDAIACAEEEVPR